MLTHEDMTKKMMENSMVKYEYNLLAKEFCEQSLRVAQADLQTILRIGHETR